MRFLFLLICSFIFLIESSFADSPLTSTNFYNSYLDVSIVKEASLSKGRITNNILKYLVNEQNPLDVKLAIINALGWNHKGVNNSKVFFNYVMNLKDYKSNKIVSSFTNFKWSASRDELICFAYLKSLDNYFNIDDAFTIASEAQRKYPNFLTVNFVFNLLKAQTITSVGEYCFASKLFLAFKTKNLEIDMRNEAFNDIFSYMIEIGKDCK